MKELNLKHGHPQVLVLAADWRLADVDYTNDIIWELSLTGGEPEVLAIQTTMGLRCGGLRLFPRFVRKDGTVSDPAKFHHSPVVQQIYPNYARIHFSPFSGLEVKAEYQVASSTVICGRFVLQNKSILKEHFRFEWAGILNSLTNGQGIAVVPFDNNFVLEGGSGDLRLVSCLSSPAKAGGGPYSSLGQEIELFPSAQISIYWALAAARTDQEAFQLSQAALQRRFDAETARIEIQNEVEELEISTGNPEWDAALVLSQRAARQLFFPAAGGMPDPSFILIRRPDQGYSITGDGSDYSSLWSGQTVLDTYFLSSLVLPGGVKWVKGLIRNFLSTQDEAGQIDWRPGLAGQRSRRLAQPMLASLALSTAEISGETEWLKDVYPGLARFVRYWFGEEHDRDQDGFPEWDHALQTGLEGSPMYDRWHPKSQGLELSVLESPALGAMLVKECRSLCQIGRLLGAEADIPWLEERAELLTAKIQETWQSEQAMYHYRDHQTHAMSAGELILEFSGSGIFPVQQDFETSQRLMVVFESSEHLTRAVTIRIKGWLGEKEVVEDLNSQRFTWVNGRGRATGRSVFSKIESIEVNGALAGDQGWVRIPDYTLEDLSLLMPLWAGIPDQDQAKAMLELSIQSEWLEKYGLAVCGKIKQPDEGGHGVLMPWNHLIGEGLLHYGFRKEAAELVRRLMEGVIHNLRTHRDFYNQVDACSGQAMGEAGHLHGMAPVGLFLRTAGIHQISPERLIIQTGSPFSHAITVKYKGTGVTLNAKEAQITFPSGQSVRVDEPGLHKVDWE